MDFWLGAMITLIVSLCVSFVAERTQRKAAEECRGECSLCTAHCSGYHCHCLRVKERQRIIAEEEAAISEGIVDPDSECTQVVLETT